jgi:Kef-type K+ transport system membrane component KefB
MMPLAFASNVESAGILAALFIILVSAKLLAELFERLKQPAVVGEILAGVIIGPSLLGIVEPSETINLLADMGVIFLLFNVGLEIKPHTILQVGKKALMVGVLGVIFPFIAGYFIASLWGGSFIESMFIGAALVATSVGITARVLGSMGLLNSETSRIILGAAVIDDILGLMILSVVSSISKGFVNYLTISKTALLAILFVVLVVGVGVQLMKWITPVLKRLMISKPLFNFGLILCLGLSFVAIYIEVAAIIGAFLAGMMLAKATEDIPKMHVLTSGVTEFLVPFFLVNIGMQLNLSIFQDSSVVLLAIVITIVAIITKFIGCALGSISLGLKKSAQVGIGMVPRGEVGIVVAQIGLGLAVMNEKFFGAVLFMAIATTLIAPPFIKLLFKGEDHEEDIHLSDIFSRIG